MVAIKFNEDIFSAIFRGNDGGAENAPAYVETIGYMSSQNALHQSLKLELGFKKCFDVLNFKIWGS